MKNRKVQVKICAAKGGESEIRLRPQYYKPPLQEHDYGDDAHNRGIDSAVHKWPCTYQNCKTIS